jgi:cysteine desulfuration protein SufE
LNIEDLIEGFELFEDWEERYRYIIEMGRKLETFPDDEKTELNRVQGCVSSVWMLSEVEAGSQARYSFKADSDSHIVRGLISILLMIYSDKTAAAIASVDIENIFDRLGLGRHLTPNRRNGFFSMVERIQNVAANG